MKAGAKLVFLVLFGSYLFSTLSFAAISRPAQKAASAPAPSSILRSEGSLQGGQAGLGFSLLGVQSHIGKNKKLERLTVLMGNGALQKQVGPPGYYQIENSPQQKRVVLNFPQTINTAFNEKTLQRQLAKSPFVQSSQMIFDPEGQTTSLVLHLKKPASLRVIPISGNNQQTAKVFVDLFDDDLIPRKKTQKK